MFNKCNSPTISIGVQFYLFFVSLISSDYSVVADTLGGITHILVNVYKMLCCYMGKVTISIDICSDLSIICIKHSNETFKFIIGEFFIVSLIFKKMYPHFFSHKKTLYSKSENSL